MRTPIPIYIQDVFSEIVSNVSTKLTTKLQTVNPRITGVHYLYGTGYEIIETLMQLSKTAPFEKYPCVCLFLNVNEEFNESLGIYSRLPELRIAIVNGTDANYKAKQRDDKNFKPILTPIYQELLEEMFLSCALQKPGLGYDHSATRNYFWGREVLYGHEANVFEDKLDAINVTFRDLKILSTYCPKPCGQQLANVGS